ncbi:MAG: M20/M25/M40 family metallo-hydrolase [Gemmatimonadaceae bacterium]|nr:M20/M25/M40 family metallo-hydrolase [Gemmatimonadaceae bacterium]
MPREIRAAGALLLLSLPSFAGAQQEPVDVATIERIKAEALDRPQVMETMSWLTDVHGPRLANSPNYRRAAEWAAAQLKSWGLVNVRFEPVTGFGRGWENTQFSMRAVAPTPFPIIAYPRAWSPGTNGPVQGEVVHVLIDSAPDFAKYRGALAGKFVLLGAARATPVADLTNPARLSDSALAVLAGAEPPRPAAAGPAPTAPRPPVARISPQFIAERYAFLASERVAGVLLPARGQEGTVFTDNGFPRGENSPPVPPTVHVAIEHYGRLARLVAKQLPVTIELDMRNRFTPVDADNFNIFAEIPGTDPKLKDEIVMLGGHFDSWHAGTGATDNAAGSATMMEAVRIIKTLGLKPKRTIRIALWASEEQGLIGSRSFARQTFRDSANAADKPAAAKFSAYYNVDNGSGKIRGVYLQGNEGVRAIFDAWMGPFKAMGMTTITARNTGGTDHLAFDALGLPGFQFIQDPLQYDTRTHHSNQDVYEQVQPDDMKFNSAVVASFVWQTAQRAEKLPRKPSPVRLAQ